MKGKFLNNYKITTALIIGICVIGILTIIVVINNRSTTEKVEDSYVASSINLEQDESSTMGVTGGNVDGDMNMLECINDTDTEEQKVEENKVIKTTNEKENKKDSVLEKFVNVAVSQLGKGPDANGVTTYGQWYQDNIDGSDSFSNAAWCAMFISWCANKAGVSALTIGYYAECSRWKNNFYVEKGKWHDASGYKPSRGDIIFFDNHNNDGVADHNGIVEKVTGSDVIVIEGNVDNRVKRCTYTLSDSKIHGYGKPDYAKNTANVAADKKDTQSNSNTNNNVNKTSASVGSGQANKIIEIAASQLGIGEGEGGWTKYGQWYQDNIDSSCYFANQAWCAMFVSWCANSAGVSKDILTPYAYCGYGIQYFKNKGDWHDRSSGYVPKKGDVIFFGVDRHTGLVDHAENGIVYTIEGNSTNSSVCRRSYSMNYSDINGYGSPKYK